MGFLNKLLGSIGGGDDGDGDGFGSSETCPSVRYGLNSISDQLRLCRLQRDLVSAGGWYNFSN